MILLIIGYAVIEFYFQSKTYHRIIDGEVRDFDAGVWSEYFLEGIFFALIAIFVTRKWTMPVVPSLIAVAAWILHYLGGMMDWYHSIEWWDHLTHGLAHIIFVLFMFYAYEYLHKKKKVDIHPVLVFTIVTVMAAGLGALSEVREYSFSLFFGTLDQGGYSNTMQDINWNFIGASLALFYYIVLNTCFSLKKENYESSEKRFKGPVVKSIIIFLIVLLIVDIFLLSTWVEKVEKYDQLWAAFINLESIKNFIL